MDVPTLWLFGNKPRRAGMGMGNGMRNDDFKTVENINHNNLMPLVTFGSNLWCKYGAIVIFIITSRWYYPLLWWIAASLMVSRFVGRLLDDLPLKLVILHRLIYRRLFDFNLGQIFGGNHGRSCTPNVIRSQISWWLHFWNSLTLPGSHVGVWWPVSALGISLW